MSSSGPRREVAFRVFADEFNDATHTYAESDEDRAPKYLVTPTGARVNRLFVVGVLTEVEEVSDDVVRARVVDPTGAFVIYAGQYQPDALAFFERTEPPMFVAVTGKARTFQPEGSDRVFTSLRPESVNEVDADTRDRWVVQTAEHTLERVAIFGKALEHAARGSDLRSVLKSAGVKPGIASGIPRAIEQYETTTAYLRSIQEMAIDAARLVAGEIDAVDRTELAPDEGGYQELDTSFAADVVLDGSMGEPAVAEDSDAEPTPEADVEGGAAPEGKGEDEASDAEREVESEGGEVESEGGEVESEGGEVESEGGEVESEGEEVESEGGEVESETSAEEAPTGSTEDAEPEETTEDEPVEATGSEAPADTPSESDGAVAEGDEETGGEPAGEAEIETDEMYELSDEERAEVEENFEVGFESGAEIESPDSEPDEEAGSEEDEVEPEPVIDEVEPEGEELGEASEPEEDEDELEPEDSSADEADTEAADLTDAELEDVVIETMKEEAGDDGIGRETLVNAVVAEYGVEEAAIEDAIQNALLGGRCFESGDDQLKPI